MGRGTLVASLVLVWAQLAIAELPVVTAGRAVATVVVAADAPPVVRYAADELVFHVKRASGATLPIVTAERAPAGQPQIRLGAVPAALLPGFDSRLLEPDACLLRTVGRTLFVSGRDTAGPPLEMRTGAGTLMGVYELLASRLGVRWLWPGELGVVVPPAQSIVLPDEDRLWTPQLIQRQVRSGNMARGDLTRGFSEAGRAAYLRDEAVFLRRHRLGSPVALRYGHAFEQYWQKYWQTHPEWFQLLENGQRGPGAPGRRYSMCVSDPGFIAQVVEEWRQREAADGLANLNGCENDIHGQCTCARCRSWDGPQPANLPARFGPRMVSDRYARFWLTAQERAAHQPRGGHPSATLPQLRPPADERHSAQQPHLGRTVPDLSSPAARGAAVGQGTVGGWARTAAGCSAANYFLDGRIACRRSSPTVRRREFV